MLSSPLAASGLSVSASLKEVIEVTIYFILSIFLFFLCRLSIRIYNR